MVAADVNYGDARRLEPAHESGVVTLARCVGGIEGLGHTRRVERLLRLVGESFAVRRVVVQDRNLVVFEMLGQILSSDLALLIVPAADAERVPRSLIRIFRVC